MNEKLRSAKFRGVESTDKAIAANFAYELDGSQLDLFARRE